MIALERKIEKRLPVAPSGLASGRRRGHHDNLIIESVISMALSLKNARLLGGSTSIESLVAIKRFTT